MLKTSKGNKSHTTTLMWIAFTLVSINYILSFFTGSTIGSFTISPIDPAAIGVYLGPILATYWSRRKTESDENKLVNNQIKE